MPWNPCPPSRGIRAHHPVESVPTMAWNTHLGLRLWIAGLILWLVGQAFGIWAAKKDPHFVEVVRRHVRIPPFLGV